MNKTTTFKRVTCAVSATSLALLGLVLLRLARAMLRIQRRMMSAKLNLV